MSEYVWKSAESRRTAGQRRKQEREAQAAEARTLVQSLGHGFEAPPASLNLGDIDAQCEERRVVPDGCMGLLIGTKGENLQSIEKRHNVSVSVKAELEEPAVKRGIYSGDKPAMRNVVVVTGRVPSDVAAAARELDFSVETMDLPPGTIGFVSGKSGRHLAFIRDISGAAAVKIRRETDVQQGAPTEDAEEEAEEDWDLEFDAEGEQQPSPEGLLADPSSPAAGAKAGRPERCWLEIRGKRDCVADAKKCFETHLAYFPVYEEMNEVERQLDRDIIKATRNIGKRVGSSRRSSSVPREASRERSANDNDGGASTNSAGGGRVGGRGAGYNGSASGRGGGRARGRGGGGAGGTRSSSVGPVGGSGEGGGARRVVGSSTREGSRRRPVTARAAAGASN